MAIELRHALSWKSWFYKVVVPCLRGLGPKAMDAALGFLGRGAVACRPTLRRTIAEAVARTKVILNADWDEPATRRALASHLGRMTARDLPIGGLTDAAVLARFDVSGREHLSAALNQGRGAIIVGSHLGAHLPALGWLDRQGVPLRLLVQRPRHVSPELHRLFDREGPHPQAGFSLRRAMTPGESAARVLRAYAALRDGMMVYLGGDILWPGPNCRPGRLLGFDRTFLAVWADLAALAEAPVLFLFANHKPKGRYALTLDPPRTIPPGGEDEAVAAFMTRLEAEIARHPADAMAYLLWPCFGPPAASVATADPRIGRRVAVAVGR